MTDATQKTLFTAANMVEAFKAGARYEEECAYDEDWGQGGSKETVAIEDIFSDVINRGRTLEDRTEIGIQELVAAAIKEWQWQLRNR